MTPRVPGRWPLDFPPTQSLLLLAALTGLHWKETCQPANGGGAPLSGPAAGAWGQRRLWDGGGPATLSPLPPERLWIVPALLHGQFPSRPLRRGKYSLVNNSV